MSELSYLEKLLDGVEVEWLPLAKVCRLINGRAYKQEELLSKGKYPVLRVGNFFTNQNWYYSDLELDQDKYCDNGDLLYAWSASFGPRIWHGGKSIYHYHIWKVVPDSNLICKQFLYYLLQWDTKALKDAHSTGSTMMHISKTTIEKRLVPIPCPDNPEKSLAIQSEIVRILDKFTALTAELTAELNMRKKQYNYYRDQLLSFDEEQEKPIYLEKLLDGVEVEWKLLGDASFFEIANNGRKPVKSSLRIAGKTPYYGANNIQDYVDGYTHDGEYVLIAEDGSASLENYSIQYATGKFWANNHVHVVRGKTRVNSRFLFHYLHIVNFIPFLTGGVRAKLTKGQLIEISVPIPCPDNTEKSLAIQAEIVRILDKFDTLTNSITEGLPREIELRQKQYEYYRDLLFSFPKPETVSN
ncbi:restriction endonuclease subunit S [Escherichia coli]|uniref:restriction endonuclease subunit S n=1 Tax=Escherichia coli TaxID=562 RepID=UPI00179A9311|nr:restriction endonuclease subunit S [Escherichia coli]EEW2253982.1 restriction endonuclease subunit S [Escherichia coli]EFB2321006.1 restriction endonuclease subunit S [Escherichia coli]EFD1734201.1 restriction endonuclease subunit S [Escherichia coli]EFD5163332.1 restriction endonuclease subunit S [Escherichia coli]EFH7712873.1 restriction endonuclease subunit S [Escherichia coli]